MNYESIYCSARRKPTDKQREVLEYVRDNPGVRYSELLKVFGKGGQAHIRTLTARRWIKRNKFPTYTTFMITTFGEDILESYET